MPLKASKTPREQVKKIRQFHRRMPKRIGGTAVSWFKQNFRRQGFPEGSGRFEKWPPRKPGASRDKGRNILVDTGNLKRSIRLETATKQQVKVSTDVPYAEIHNQGGRINTTAQVRAHTRRTRRGRTQVQAHKRKMDITMPQRQFMGNSQALNKRLRKMITQELRKALS
jgi:phage virion morphogenesis protein